MIKQVFSGFTGIFKTIGIVAICIAACAGLCFAFVWPVWHIAQNHPDAFTTVVLCLPPSLNWAARTQNIEILVSDSNVAYTASTVFTSIVSATNYLFDPTQGNRVTIELTPVNCRFFKLVINSNDVKAGYGAQLSEISVYGN